MITSIVLLILIRLATQADEDLYSGYGDSGPLAVRLTIIHVQNM